MAILKIRLPATLYSLSNKGSRIVEVECPAGYRRVWRGAFKPGDLFLNCVLIYDGIVQWQPVKMPTMKELARDEEIRELFGFINKDLIEWRRAVKCEYFIDIWYSGYSLVSIEVDHSPVWEGVFDGSEEYSIKWVLDRIREVNVKLNQVIAILGVENHASMSNELPATATTSEEIK